MARSLDEKQTLRPQLKKRKSFFTVNCLIPFFFVATFIVAFSIFIGKSQDYKMTNKKTHIKYSTVTGYFLQDDPATEPIGFDYTAVNFGLINRSYGKDSEFDPKSEKTQWQRFENEVNRLNHESEKNINYKVFFMGRHGEGDHNVAEVYYGTEAWDCYWSLQDGNGTANWVDAHLTPIGEAQAVKAHDFWAHLIKDEKIPFPESYYTSPLRRCLATATLTFKDLPLPASHPFKPLIKELFREVIGAHTCDKRSSKSVIHSEYPDYPFEDGFAEEDPLFLSEWRETDEAHDQRSKKALDQVFEVDGNTWISLSAHSGMIASLLRVLEHRVFRLGTGQVIPVLIKAETLDGEAPHEEPKPWMKIIPCEKPPARTEPPIIP